MRFSWLVGMAVAGSPALAVPAAVQATRGGASTVGHVPARPVEPEVPTPLAPGWVRHADELGSLTPGFTDELDWFDQFGRACASIGDLDGDGVSEYAVGSNCRPGAANVPPGRVWIFFPRADGSVKRYQKISATEGGFGTHASGDDFSAALSALGDLDGDGVPDLAVGAPLDSDGGTYRGAVWILFLHADGTVKARQKINGLEGGFTGTLDDGDLFGGGLAAVGDLDGDSVVDLAVGAPWDDDTTNSRFSNLGAVWLLLLRPDGTVKGHHKISQATVLPPGLLRNSDHFGRSLAALGDRNGDGVPDLAVGSEFYSHPNASAFRSGAVYLLDLMPEGPVVQVDVHEISELEGGFQGDNFHLLGADGIAPVRDLDGDGIQDLAVGGYRFNSLDPDHAGYVWILFLNADGSVRAQQAIGSNEGGMGSLSSPGFGVALAALGDAAGSPFDLLVGHLYDTDDPYPVEDSLDGSGRGALWTLALASDGTVVAATKNGGGGEVIPNGTLDPNDGFGVSVANLGDLDSDGFLELAVGAPGDDEGGRDHGCVWVLSFDAARNVRAYRKISTLEDCFGGLFQDGDAFGSAVAMLGDLDGDGRPELAVGSSGDDDGGEDRGAVWVLSLNPEGSVHRAQKISSLSGGLGAALVQRDGFGAALAPVGDLNRDGVCDLAVGAPGSLATGQMRPGRCFVLFLEPDGTVASTREIGDGIGGLPAGSLHARDQFGASLVSPGDVDGDGVDDLAVGAFNDDDGGGVNDNYGALWIFLMRTDGSARLAQKINPAQGGFGEPLHLRDSFGTSLAATGDLDGDGVADLAVGMPRHETPDGELNTGGVWILFLAQDATVARKVLLDADSGGFPGPLLRDDHFGSSLFAGVDLDGDGVRDLLVGADGDDDGGTNEGVLWRLELEGIATLDFRNDTALGLRPLRNGQALGAPAAFGRTLELTSYGSNLGPAIFDSRALGPNDPSQDRDLLIGRDNLAILQNDLAPAQTVPGFFDHPNDDENGGTILVRFLAGAVTPLSLDLVDIDQGPLESAAVTLLDTAGRTRTYSIPAGWTEDLVSDGPPGFRTLDLTTLAPQPGFAATATATEAAGFDARAVVRIEVLFGSSGALDNLRWAPRPLD